MIEIFVVGLVCGLFYGFAFGLLYRDHQSFKKHHAGALDAIRSFRKVLYSENERAKKFGED